MNRWRGLLVLVKDAVENGSKAIEKIQIETANRPFGVLEQVPPIAQPVKAIHAIFDLSVTTTHSAIRLVNHVVGGAVDAVLASVERAQLEKAGKRTALDDLKDLVGTVKDGPRDLATHPKHMKGFGK